MYMTFVNMFYEKLCGSRINKVIRQLTPVFPLFQKVKTRMGGKYKTSYFLQFVMFLGYKRLLGSIISVW